MPGLSQLKQFSQDLLSIGDEVSVRASRGEKPVTIPIPKDITIDNDSEEFVLGMPENEAVQISTPVEEDLSDLAGFTSRPAGNKEETPAPGFEAPDLSSLLSPVSAAPDSSSGDMPDLSMFMEPEEEKEEVVEEEEPEEISIADMGLEALLAGGGFDQTEEPEEDNSQSKDSEIGEFEDIDSLDSIDSPSSENVDPLEMIDADLQSLDSSDSTQESKNDQSDIDLASLGDDFDTSLFAPAEENKESTDDGISDLGEIEDLPSDFDNPLNDQGLDDLAPLDDLGSDDKVEDFGIDDIGPVEEATSKEATSKEATSKEATSKEATSKEATSKEVDPAESTDDFGLEDIGAVEDLPSDFDNPLNDQGLDDLAPLDDLGSEDKVEDFGIDEIGPVEEATSEESTDNGESFDLPEDMNDSGDFSSENDQAHDLSSGDSDSFDLPVIGEDAFDLPEQGSDDNAEASDSSSDSDDLTAGPDFSDFASDFDLSEMDNISTDGLDDANNTESADSGDNFEADAGQPSDGTSIDDFNLPGDGVDFDDSSIDFDDTSADGGENIETFDTSEMEGVDFDLPETDAQLGPSADFELGNGDEFAMEGDFEIPGFSDVETVKEEKKSKEPVDEKSKGKNKKKKEDIDVADFSDAMESEELPPNTLSDEQYKVFLNNLGEYPLNVRLAVEDLLVKDEFTEDAEFEIVEKVLNKVPARQLASTLEKMLDTSIPVPRDFEHRTAEEYEAYKKSLSYQLRNKIIPGAIALVALLFVGWGLFNFGKNCIYKPIRAAGLYKQGYNLLVENEYPQSEMKFNEAIKYRLSKKWFFAYARGYREHKQYQRAEEMYTNILYCFKHDKAAGLEYADMELSDLANYEKAEDIVRREVLDYHINDSDGILLLGDIFLEWGTEKDPEKLEMARQQYATLIQLYEANDLYMSRMMRYFIRSDKLLDVLQIKDTFQKDKQLAPEDWTELSGYLLDKYYGPLSPSEEYLRYRIEGLRGLLLRAVATNSKNPISHYNLGRYYVLSNEIAGIEPTLQNAIKTFNNSESLKRRDIYKYIDSYRLLGEYYIETNDYLQAQDQFAEGISLYTTERDNAGFEGTPEVGKLYEDLANIKYFISGDYDEALINYQNSIELGNDSPEMRYKIGYIQYNNKKYIEALGSFMKAGEGNIKEENLMLAMANTLSLRGDDYAAQGYYERLINKLDLEIADSGLVLPQKNLTDNDLVTSYLYAANNYGVSLYRLAKRTGNSSLNAQAIVQFQQSLRAWDSLTRNQDTLLRIGGSNLAEENIKYITHKLPEFEPSIYLNIPNTLKDKEKL